MPKSEQFLIIKGTLFISVAMLLSFLVVYELMGKSNVNLGQISWNNHQKLQAENNDVSMTSHEHESTSGSRKTEKFDPEIDPGTTGPDMSNQSTDVMMSSTKTPDSNETTLEAEVSRESTTQFSTNIEHDATSETTSIEHEVTTSQAPELSTAGTTTPGVHLTDVPLTNGQMEIPELKASPTFQITPTISPSTNNTNITSDANDTSNQIQTTNQPTTEDQRPLCLREDFTISDTCDVDGYLVMTFGKDVTLEDVSDMVFNRPTLDRLRHVCEPGDWCLDDDWQLVADDNDFLDFCFTANCLVEEMSDDCLDEKRRLVLSSLLLLCETAAGNYSDICFLATRKMTHVTLSLLENPDELTDTNDCGAFPDNCSDTCHQFAEGLHCLCDICGHDTTLLKSYPRWNWFLADDNAMKTCGIDNGTECSFLLSPTESWFDTMWGKLKSVDEDDDSNVRLISLLTAAGILVASGIAVSLWACFRKGSVFRRYSRKRVDYMEVQPEEDFYD